MCRSDRESGGEEREAGGAEAQRRWHSEEVDGCKLCEMTSVTLKFLCIAHNVQYEAVVDDCRNANNVTRRTWQVNIKVQ